MITSFIRIFFLALLMMLPSQSYGQKRNYFFVLEIPLEQSYLERHCELVLTIGSRHFDTVHHYKEENRGGGFRCYSEREHEGPFVGGYRIRNNSVGGATDVFGFGYHKNLFGEERGIRLGSGFELDHLKYRTPFLQLGNRVKQARVDEGEVIFPYVSLDYEKFSLRTYRLKKNVYFFMFAIRF